ncbi:MAG TPA: hypothetical protein VN843_31165 [Anaerolineales bacterium]|nr:hypothetical protein [Anaerolineales bacterium]
MMSSDVERKNFPDDPSLWKWYLNWCYEIHEPLVMLSGFSEVLLKDLNGSLNKPLIEDDKRKFLEIVFNKSKSIQRSFKLLDLFLRCKEDGYPDLVVWNGKSAAKILEDVFEELQGEKKFAKVMLNGMDNIPLVRTSEDLLKSVFTILLTYIYNRDEKEWVIEVQFEKIEDFYVSIEINTNFQHPYWGSLTIDQLLNEPPYHLLMSKFLIESLDGKFEASFRDKHLVYKMLLPIWWLPEAVNKTIKTNLEDQVVELILGQELEVIRVLEENVKYDLSLVEIVECDRNVIANIARGQGPNSTYRLNFAGVKVGSTDLKLQYSPPNDTEPIFYNMRVTVKPQMPDMR